MRRLRLVLLGFAALAAAPTAALAAPVDLRSDAFSENGRVTLGDLFDGAGAAASVVVAQGQPGQNLVLDAGRVQSFAHLRGLDWDNAKGIRRIIVQAGSGPASPAPAAAAVKRGRASQTLTFVHNLEAGDIVQAQDLSWSKTADAPLDAPSDPDAVIGKAARRPMREGAAVSMHDVVAPQVIKKDDIVSVVFNQGGIALTLQAKALDNAVPGQPLSVVNQVSKKVIQAVAVGPGQAVVGPEADQLKANARSSLSRLAQR
ncbi:MAG: flgA [Caulobacteraceae bacterium]|nr:flgA [Caulobacteraceae bacterium]